MVTLTLNNGTQISVLETSTPNMINVSGDLTTINTAIEAITTDTLKNADLNGTLIANKVYTGFSGSREEDVFTVSFTLRDKTDMEIMQEQLNDTNDALVELAEMIGG